MDSENRQGTLITGVAGFIGAHLAERLLQQGATVVGIDNFDPFYPRWQKEQNLAVLAKAAHGNFSFHEADIRDKQALQNIALPIDAVVHIAAKAGVRPSILAPQEYIDTNISGTNNVLEFMRSRHISKLIFASSSSVYGNNKKTPFSEDDAVDFPISPYAFTKKANELQIHTYHHLYGIDALCLRFFTVFGPRQRPDLAIRKFIDRIDRNEPIDMYGDGNTGRDYTYVSDTVAGILKALAYLREHQNVYEIINLGNSAPVKLKEMIAVLYEEMQKQPQVNQLPMQPGDVELTFADITKAKNMLGYEPQVSFREGIRRFIAWQKTLTKNPPNK